MINCRDFIVIVEGDKKGSGCLIQAMSDDYDYILTAKHLIGSKALNEIIVLGDWLDENKKIVNQKIKLFGNEKYVQENQNIDAVILRVEKGQIKGDLLKSEIKTKAILNLCGFPKTRESNSERYKQDDIKIEQPKEYGYFEASFQGTIPLSKEEVDGYSGGGIFRIQDDSITLVAIQSQMAVDDKEEQHGRIDIMPLSVYDKIIKEKGLAPILPDSLSCFSKFKESIFKFDECASEENVRNTRQILKDLTNEVIKTKITPFQILSLYEDCLLAYGEEKKTVFDKELWRSWLEFLIIIKISEYHDITKDDLHENVRLLFSTSKKHWYKEMPNILKSNFKGLSKGGHVIYSNECPTKKGENIIEGEIINNIANAISISSSDLLIDDGLEHPLKDFRIIHFSAFLDDIINNHKDYATFTSLNQKELIVKLKNEYDRIFNK